MQNLGQYPRTLIEAAQADSRLWHQIGDPGGRSVFLVGREQIIMGGGHMASGMCWCQPRTETFPPYNQELVVHGRETGKES